MFVHCRLHFWICKERKQDAPNYRQNGPFTITDRTIMLHNRGVFLIFLALEMYGNSGRFLPDCQVCLESAIENNSIKLSFSKSAKFFVAFIHQIIFSHYLL